MKALFRSLKFLIRWQLHRIWAAIIVIAGIGALLARFFEGTGGNEALLSLANAFWWAFVTLTTVGYGDIVPQTDGGRIVGISLAFAGIVMAAILSGRMASILVEYQLKESRGMKDLSTIHNHFVICGWKAAMGPLLIDLLSVEPELRPEDIVLVNSADPEVVSSLRSQEPFSEMQYVHGDFVEEATLQRAAVPLARRVLILANDTGQYSHAEIDARTIMAVMTISKLTIDTYVCAELLDRKFAQHLVTSGCDEVIMTRESSRVLLANASAGTGISSIYETLMKGRGASGLATHPFDGSFIGRTFGELRDHFAKSSGALLVGVVENTGNMLLRKREALREAQKTPDISKLVKNLAQVKTLISNNPVLNPPTDYILKSHSLAVIINKAEIEKAAG